MCTRLVEKEPNLIRNNCEELYCFRENERECASCTKETRQRALHQNTLLHWNAVQKPWLENSPVGGTKRNARRSLTMPKGTQVVNGPLNTESKNGIRCVRYTNAWPPLSCTGNQKGDRRKKNTGALQSTKVSVSRRFQLCSYWRRHEYVAKRGIRIYRFTDWPTKNIPSVRETTKKRGGLLLFCAKASLRKTLREKATFSCILYALRLGRYQCYWNLTASLFESYADNSSSDVGSL